VWRAEHQLLARPAAMKLIRATVDERQADELRARFEREAQAIARCARRTRSSSTTSA
jgi:hypothetical protein